MKYSESRFYFNLYFLSYLFRTFKAAPFVATLFKLIEWPLCAQVNWYSLSKTFSDSQKPMVFIEAETALAKAKTTPTDAPNSGPSERDMMK